MKKLILLTALFISLVTSAQVPQGISYQAIALTASGTPVVSSNVRVRLSILDNTATGTVLYSETQLRTTNANGLFNLTIGQGTQVSGAFNTINWRVNNKFLKVEMDVTGGTNYVLVGTTQLLSVPYALAADSLVTSAGEGITLVSPNGTPYQLSVNDAGQLSLPNATTGSNVPNVFYMYGTFNSYNASTALLMNETNYVFYGYKYLTSGTQIKFIPENNSNTAVYGINGAQSIVQNGSAYTIPSTGFYYFQIIYQIDGDHSLSFYPSAISPVLITQGTYTPYNPTYNTATNTFSFTVTGVTTADANFLFNFDNPGGFTSSGTYGDMLNDGTIDNSGPAINFPGATSTPKNYRVDLIINFNGSGTYTVTQIP